MRCVFKKCVSIFIRLTVLSLLVYCDLFGQLIPTNDPLYGYLRQQFRQEHDLYYFIRPAPYPTAKFDDRRFPVTNKTAFFRVNPSLIIYNDIPLSIIDIWYSGTWHSLSFLIEPVLVNSNYGATELGETYERAGFSARYESALIQFRWDNNLLTYGRSSMIWGQSFDSSIILSGNFPPFDYLSTFLDLGLFKLSLFTGQLHSGINTLGRFKRFIAGKKLIFVLRSGKTMLSMGDLILYSGLNRSIEFQYLNPFVPYFFTDLEKETEIYPVGGVDNDNTMIFFDGRHIVQPQHSIYFELLIDDFQIDIKRRDSVIDALGIKVGFDGMLSIASINIGYEAEYTRISGYTYITRGWYTNWEDRNIPLGYKYGPDCQALFLLFDYWLNDKVLIQVNNEYLEKGELTLNSIYNPYDKVGNPFPTGNVHYHYYFNPSISWHSKYSIIEIGFDGDLHRFKQSMFYLKAQIVVGFGYDM